jgi:hypothetical protein
MEKGLGWNNMIILANSSPFREAQYTALILFSPWRSLGLGPPSLS